MKLLLLALMASLLFQASPRAFQRDLDRIHADALSPGPHPDLFLAAADVNAYLASPGAVKLPAAVSHVLLGAGPGRLSGSAQIDFDQLARRYSNPLLALFAGVHSIALTAVVISATAPAAHLNVTSVRLDGEEVPSFLIDLAVAAFLKPKYPQLGRTFSVPLPEHCSSAEAARDRVILHYQIMSNSGSK